MDQTLHDFVLNLLTDADARSAFDLDPEGALRAAGLGDITAADVQDVVPLVVDYAPVQGLAPVAPVTGQLGLDPLVGDATDAISQLQTVAQQISVGSSHSGVDVKAGVLGTIAVDPSTVTAGASVFPGVGVGVTPTGVGVDLSGVHDVADTLDADVVAPIDRVTEPALGDVTGTVGDLASAVHGTGSGLLDTTSGLLPGTTSQVGDLVGSLGVDDTLGELGLTGDTRGVAPSLDLDSTVGGVTGQVDGLLGGVTGNVTGGTKGLLDGGVSGSVSGDTATHGEASTSTGGVLGLTDGLL
ncbi:IniB N-terminal domain-containing protein [Verrucosispora sp. WMMA2044]|uniref:IniB N-terminal domain-containing protein n=1 Tax=Verrucosispora sp. WMMA2044 TaxID=3016419 RepID=UPI00248D14C3|nr:IniB N-terminal domain-containing protein [Verrucosispora sp. WMMA2044]WBB50593.1 IniB N-terminal domain-containing protein [Verrucosispora sp. WMMA2044]